MTQIKSKKSLAFINDRLSNVTGMLSDYAVLELKLCMIEASIIAETESEERHAKELQELKEKAIGAFILSCSCGVKQGTVGSATIRDMDKCRECTRYKNFLTELNK